MADAINGGPDSIHVLANGQLHRVIQLPGEPLDAPVYSPTGHVLYHRQGRSNGIWGIPFSIEQMAATGEPFLVAANALWPSVSMDGTLVHTRADSNLAGELSIVERDGRLRKALGQDRTAIERHKLGADPRCAASWIRV